MATDICIEIFFGDSGNPSHIEMEECDDEDEDEEEFDEDFVSRGIMNFECIWRSRRSKDLTDLHSITMSSSVLVTIIIRQKILKGCAIFLENYST